MKYVIGHKNPDSDTVLSALAYARIKNSLGEKVESLVAGKLNKESKHILGKLGLDEPKVIHNVNKDDEFILVDHNEEKQRVEGMENIIEIIDHHKFDFINPKAIPIDVRPYGSTCTILYEKAKEKNWKLDRKTKEILFYGIIADTICFRLPTTSDEDREYAKELSKELNLDIEKTAEEMLMAGSDVSDVSDEDLVFGDSKEFTSDEGKVCVGVITIAKKEQVFDRIEDFLEIIKTAMKEKNYASFLLSVIYVLEGETEIYGFGPSLERVAKEHSKEVKDSLFTLDWVVARKKDIAPYL